MIHSPNRAWGLLIAVASWAALLAGLWAVSPKRIGRVYKVEEETGQRVQVSVPWFGHEELGPHRFDAELIHAAKKLSVRADDCVERLEVDGKTIFVTQPSDCLHCAYTDFMMPSGLKGSLVRFVTRNVSGEAWFDIKEAHGFTVLKFLMLLLWGFGAFWLARRCDYPAWIGWPLAIAGLLAIQYLDVTTPWVRQHDVSGHREYIEYLGTTGRLPDVQQDWETWQPPLYYCIAAGWRFLFSNSSYDDSFRPVQFLSTGVFLTTIVLSLLVFRRLNLSGLEAAGALAVMALVPGNLFFAARINNDTFLPLLGACVLFTTVEFVQSGERRWLWWLSPFLALMLATKGSSLAVVGGAILMILWAGTHRFGWRLAVWRTYLAALPAGLWQMFWLARTAAQTGHPFYVNAALPDYMRVLRPTSQRLLSFDFAAFIGGRFYYDDAVRQSYPTALATSLLYGEYGMNEYGFHLCKLLRWGCLGILLLMFSGAVIRPRAGLRPAWRTCLCLAGCQTAITVAYAVQFPFACNQNMRFFAQAFVPFSCLCGFGAGNIWHHAGWLGRATLTIISGVFLLGLAEFYLRILF